MPPRVFVTGLLIVALTTACADPPPATPSAVDPPVATTVTVQRGSIVSTLVVPATVRADVGVTITAPAPGRYAFTGTRVGYELDSGRQGTLALPAGVRIVTPLVRPGRHVPRNLPLAEARVNGFALVARLDEAALYRLYAVPLRVRGQVTQGPGPFTCPLANPVPQPAPGGGDETDVGPGTLVLTCVIPAQLHVFAGMPAVMAITTAAADNVLVLPVEAVAGSSQHGQVWLVDAAGRRHVRDVRLGITDGAQIEITSGLREGDRVLIGAADLLLRGH